MPGETFIGNPWRQPYTAQQLAAAAANQVPIVGPNGNWMRWDIDTSAWVDTGTTVATGLADGSVTTQKLADGAVDWTKLAAEARPIRTQLLDNARWDNPAAIVDQRNGYVILGGTPIYRDPGLTQLIGNASVPCPVVTRTSTYVEVAEPNNLAIHYYAQPGTDVRGYCQAGYTIDRWRTWDNRVTITLTTNGLNIEISSTPENPNFTSPFVQYLEFKRFPPNSPLTASVLVGDNLLVSTGSTAAGVPRVSMQGIDMGCIKEPTRFAFYLSVKNGTKVSGIKAAKLELGTHQTLAHESAGGGWILNDPAPNFTLELEKCKPYQTLWNIEEASRVRAASVSTNYIEFIVPVPTTLKKAPTLVYDGDLFVCTVDNMIVSGFTFLSNVYGPGWVEIVAIKTNHGMTDAQLRYTFSGDQHPLIFDSNL